MDWSAGLGVEPGPAPWNGAVPTVTPPALITRYLPRRGCFPSAAVPALLLRSVLNDFLCGPGSNLEPRMIEVKSHSLFDTLAIDSAPNIVPGRLSERRIFVLAVEL